MKNLLNRVIGGFVIGVIIGQIVQVLISLKLGHGEYMPVVDHFRSFFDSEIAAVAIQILLTGIIGITFATSSLIFDIAKWSLLKQYIVHFCITAIVWIPIVIILWMPKTLTSTLIFIISFFSTYIITWVIQYMMLKKDIKQINVAIHSKQSDERRDD